MLTTPFNVDNYVDDHYLIGNNSFNKNYNLNDHDSDTDSGSDTNDDDDDNENEQLLDEVEDDMRRFELSAQGSARKHRHEV